MPSELLPSVMLLASTTDVLLRFYDLDDDFGVGCHESAELLQGQEGRPVPCHVPNDEVSQATVVLWGCVVDKVYDLKYPSKRWIYWRPLRSNWLKVLKSGAKFVFCQLLQASKVEFFSHGLHSGMKLEWEKKARLGPILMPSSLSNL